MTYNTSVPASGQSLGETQPIIQQNFSDINTAFGKNHIPLTTSNDGKHKFLQLPESGTGWDNNSSPPATAANEGGLYVAAVGGVSQLHFRGENTGSSYQLTTSTAGADGNITTFGTDTNYQVGPPSLNGGWTFLPGGLIMQWGNSNTAASTDVFTYTFPRTFPNNVWNIQVTGYRAPSSPGNVTDAWVSTSNLTTSGFQVYNNGSHSFQFYWLAIGN